MAGIRAGLITGANAKIKFGGLTMAYCTDVNYSQTVQTIPVETMGRYEVVTNEPIGTTVEGTFSIVRYTRAVAGTGIFGTSGGNLGNGAAEWNLQGVNANSPAQTGLSMMDPAQIITSSTVDLEIYQKVGNSSANLVIDSLSIKTIRDCRLTRVSGSINKRGVLVETFQFVAILLDDGDQPGQFEGTSGDTDLSPS